MNSTVKVLFLFCPLINMHLLCWTGGAVTAADLPGTGYGKSHTQVDQIEVVKVKLENTSYCTYLYCRRTAC